MRSCSYSILSIYQVYALDGAEAYELCSRKALLAIYKSFVRPHLNYGDILYDKLGNLNFESKIQSLYCNNWYHTRDI